MSNVKVVTKSPPPPPVVQMAVIELSLGEARDLRRILSTSLSTGDPLIELYRQLGNVPGAATYDY